jgi:hypothetical protein
MRVLDRYYQLYQSALGGRARELEGPLEFKLETEILRQYRKWRMWEYAEFVYGGFEAVILVLGLAVVWGNWTLVAFAIIIPVAGIIFILATDRFMRPHDVGLIQPRETEGTEK